MIELLDKNWREILTSELGETYFQQLTNKVEDAYLQETVFPPKQDIFAALNLCALADIKVVIIGQDPYHHAGAAHGLAFSVPDGFPIPPSLRNIFKEVQNDVGGGATIGGNLTPWANQGVLLLNSVLTVAENRAGSHRKFDWEKLTDQIIRVISRDKEHAVFILWGKFAAEKSDLIDSRKHLVLTAAHPSPLSAYRGFFGCKHFSQTNRYLTQNNLTPVIW